MSVCTFFGHREFKEDIEQPLVVVLQELIERDGVDEFYVGNHGQFDRLVKKVMLQMCEKYPHVRFHVVLSRLPQGEWCCVQDGERTIYPEEVAKAMPRFAILARNRWMLDRADVAVTYVKHSMGGSGRFKEMAERKNKRVINLPDWML